MLVDCPQPQQVLVVVILLVAQALHAMVEQHGRLTPLLHTSKHKRHWILSGTLGLVPLSVICKKDTIIRV